MSNDRVSESEIADSIYRHVTEVAPWCSGEHVGLSTRGRGFESHHGTAGYFLWWVIWRVNNLGI